MKNSNFRELTWTEIINMLNKVQYCRLVVSENNEPYVVPMFFSFRCEEDKIKFTLKSKYSGLKMKYMNMNSKVSLEFDRNIGNAFDSIIASGQVKIYKDPCELNCVILEVISTSITGRRTFICS